MISAGVLICTFIHCSTIIATLLIFFLVLQLHMSFSDFLSNFENKDKKRCQSRKVMPREFTHSIWWSHSPPGWEDNAEIMHFYLVRNSDVAKYLVGNFFACRWDDSFRRYARNIHLDKDTTHYYRPAFRLEKGRTIYGRVGVS